MALVHLVLNMEVLILNIVVFSTKYRTFFLFGVFRTEFHVAQATLELTK